MPPPQQTIQYIKDSWTREEFPARSLLVKEGALAKKLFYIDKGCARVWFNNGDKEVTYQFLFEGNYASHMETIFNNEPSWYNIETLEPTVTYSITIADFRTFMKDNPRIKEEYDRYIYDRLSLYVQLFVSRIKDNPEKRYRDLIEQYPEIVRRVPQHHIASFLGITSVSLSRIRNRK